VQAVETSGGEKARHGLRAALDHNAAKPVRRQAGEQSGRRDVAVVRRQRHAFDARRQVLARALRRHHQPGGAVGEQVRRCRQAPARIDDHARRMRSAHPPHRQLRIVGEHRADADHHRIDEGAQPMQVRESIGAVDVVRVAAHRGHAPVERLADLADDDEIVDCALPERAEKLFPWRRQNRAGTEGGRYGAPRVLSRTRENRPGAGTGHG